jgi:hypothetical protein
MKEIIPPVDKMLLENELTQNKMVRLTRSGNNKIYIVTAHDSPNVLKEIGRLREITFRRGGGGTGKELDLDDLDLSENPYRQLIVWDPLSMEIIGGYRFMHCGHATLDEKGIPLIATAKLFNFSDRFVKDYLPYTIELGRSFVQPDYQPMVNSRKGIFSLDNLWDGLGTLVVDYPDIRYFFGKVTMYPHFNRQARDIILYFLFKYFRDKDNLVTPLKPIQIETEIDELEALFNGGNYGTDYKQLLHAFRQLDEHIPPLINQYMNLTTTMRTFGTALNENFGNVEETGILVTIKDIHSEKKDRHLATYKKDNQ